MRRFIIKRIIISLFMLLLLSFFVYCIIRLMPGDYVKNSIAGNTRISQEMKNSLMASYGLNDNFASGFIKWISSAVMGKLGISLLYREPVINVIGSRVLITLFISGAALILEISVSIFLGMTAAVKKFKRFDRIISFFSVASISLPGFFFAVILQRFLAVKIPLFPISGMVSVRGSHTGLYLLLDILWHMFLPIVVLVVTGIGAYTKFIRTNTLNILNSDYVLAARAKGLSNRKVMRKHVFPNTLVPLISIISTNIPLLFTRTLIVEQIFSINGLGHMAFSALKMSDTPLIMGFTIIISAVTIFSVLLCDIIYTIVDPRIRIGKG